MIVKCRIADNRIQTVSFIPCWINQAVQPEPLAASDPRSDEVLRYMTWMCKSQRISTNFQRSGDEIEVRLD